MKKARLQERKALINGYNLYIVYYKELLPVKKRQSRTHLSVTWTIVFDFVRFGAAGRTWTGTDVTPRDFKSLASAYSTTAAKKIHSAPNAVQSAVLEAPPGFEPGDKGFADLCLTTWLWLIKPCSIRLLGFFDFFKKRKRNRFGNHFGFYFLLHYNAFLGVCTWLKSNLFATFLRTVQTEM